MATNLTIDDCKHELRMNDFSHDPYGTTMHYWFIVADEICFFREKLDVPFDWEFRPSPFGAAHDDCPLEVEFIQMLDDETLLQFGEMLHRLYNICKRKGWNY